VLHTQINIVDSLLYSVINLKFGGFVLVISDLGIFFLLIKLFDVMF